MSETKNATTNKVLRTHDRIVNWSWLLADLLLLTLLLGGFCVWHMGQYLGSFSRLPAMVRFVPRFYEAPFQVVLDMEAMAMERVWKEAGANGRLIPVPRTISAGCGLAWCAAPDSERDLTARMQENGIVHQGIHRCLI